ncbi:MAG: hypothetical protein JNJ80_03105 [Gemmatimonadetes bacterium]|nr:hypothetical protein [Gemmatimonadota bacterium]
MRWTAGWWLMAAVAAGSACLSTTGIDPSKETIAVVTGQVTRQDGSAVGGPLVSVELLSAVSNGSAKLLSQATVIGDTNGRFLFLFLLTGEVAQTGSANLVVTPPIGSSLAPFDTVGIPVKIVQGRNPTDTTYVQMALSPR